MIPLSDRNPTRRTAWVTLLIIVVCTVIYLFVQPTGFITLVGRTADDEVRFTLQNAAIPCEVVEGRPLTQREVSDTFAGGDATACHDEPPGDTAFPGKNVYLAMLYSMFLHGSLLHLGGNMLYLWIFGNNIEEHLGVLGYLAFYVASGLAATAAHIAIQPDSTVPVVGASGAIAGVMGAYLVVFPHVYVRTLLVFIFITVTEVQARWLLGFWFVSQFFVNPNEGVAWMAHVGGFVFGALFGLVWRLRTARQRHRRRAGYGYR